MRCTAQERYRLGIAPLPIAFAVRSRGLSVDLHLPEEAGLLVEKVFS